MQNESWICGCKVTQETLGQTRWNRLSLCARHYPSISDELLQQSKANAEAMAEWLDWELPPSLREAIQGRLVCTKAAIDKAK